MRQNSFNDLISKIIKTNRVNKKSKTVYLLLVLFFAFALPASAATFTVSKVADTNDGVCDADCSLREAVGAANAVNSADVIVFDAGVFSTPRTITLTTSELRIDSNSGGLTINGTGANVLTISGGNQNRIFYINSGTSATFNNLRLTGGNAGGATFNNLGGAIAVYSSVLNLNDVVISGNTAGDVGGGIYAFFNAEVNIVNSVISQNRAVEGGGIYSQVSSLRIVGSSVDQNTTTSEGAAMFIVGGNATIAGSTVSGNTATGGTGGILNSSGVLTISGSSINNNTGTSGGGISSLSATVNLTDTTISRNRVSGEGGGIRHSGGGPISPTLTITRCKILENVAGQGGGGLYSLGNFSMTDSTVSGNTGDAGGGINNDGGGTIFSSTIDSNTANSGGGIYNRNGLGLVNSTVSGNRAATEGGGIYSISTVDVHYSTIAFNRAATGAGVFIPSGRLQAQSTIFSDNLKSDNTIEDIFGTLAAGGHNLISSMQNAVVLTDSTDNILGQSARLDPVLRNNGGFTQTHALRPNSPAIDAALNGGVISVMFDQRGRPRPFDVPNIQNAPSSDGSDIGAFERYFNDPARTVFFDFDGDSRSDISVFRPSEGAWYLQQSRDGFAAKVFGTSTDIIVPADYDGDGKTDVAVFRRGDNSTWYIMRSSDNSLQTVQFGATNNTQAILFDVPVPADYDGDGKADIAIWRTTDAIGEAARFIIRRSSDNTVQNILWGGFGDVPVPADYDGDGRADAAVVRGGTWYVRQSGNEQLFAVSFGLATDKKVPADYDGDGKTDVAVVRQTGGVSNWYILGSSSGFFGTQFGTDTDKPVPADYDGDGKTDVAVFRPSNGAWYLQQSAAGFAGVVFGISTDLPIPNAYVR